MKMFVLGSSTECVSKFLDIVETMVGVHRTTTLFQWSLCIVTTFHNMILFLG